MTSKDIETAQTTQKTWATIDAALTIANQFSDDELKKFGISRELLINANRFLFSEYWTFIEN